jgi:hypothetical protein
MPRTKSKASPQKQPRRLATAAVPRSQETTIQCRICTCRRDPFPSLTVATVGETVAQSVADAAEDSAFAHNPNDLSIDNSTDLDDDKDLDDDEDSEDDPMTNNSNDNDAVEENSDEDDADPHNYSKLVDSSQLEDDEPSVSYCVDRVKGKGAGQKFIKGHPPKPDTTLMSADEAKDAIDQ